MYINEQTYLEHYGVKGMRWGVRKEENRDRIRRAGNATMDTRARAIGGAKTAGKNLKYAVDSAKKVTVAKSKQRAKEAAAKKAKIENINKRYDKKYGEQGKKNRLINNNYRDAKLFDKARYSTGKRFVANMTSYSLFALARRGGPGNLARMGPYGRKLALMDTGVSAAASAFVTGYQNVRINQTLKKYNNDGTLKKR